MVTRTPEPPPLRSPAYLGELADVWRSAGLAPTRARRQVVDQLGGRERPATARELFAELRTAGSGVGLSTVYRTLNALARAGVVHVFDHDGEAAYRRCGQRHHHHLICRCCGLVLERAAGPVEAWVATIATADDFEPEAHQAEVYGTCGGCRRGTRCHHRTGGDHRSGRPHPAPTPAAPAPACR